MLTRLTATDRDWARFLARIAVAAVMFPHGAQKLLGWFGGKGFSGTIDLFTSWGFPAFLVFALIVTESIGAILLALGFLGRVWAAAMAVVMVVAVLKVHLQFGFFMNWYAQPRGEGFEYHILLFALSLITIIGGSGRWSIDRALHRRLTHPADLPTAAAPAAA